MQTDKCIKTDPDLKPYFDLRAELYMAEGLILRIDRIIPSESLRNKIIQIAHKQGHLGISKIKEMLRRKYWFPTMNHRIDIVVSTCFDCQIATITQHTEPAKMTKLPETLGNHRNWLLWTIPKQRVRTGYNRPILKIPRGRVCLLNSHEASTTEDEKRSSPLTEFPRPSNQTMDHHLTPKTSRSLQRKWDSHTKKSHHDIPKPRDKWKASTSSWTRQPL